MSETSDNASEKKIDPAGNPIPVSKEPVTTPQPLPQTRQPNPRQVPLRQLQHPKPHQHPLPQTRLQSWQVANKPKSPNDNRMKRMMMLTL
jgi:hypothetical protein